MRKAATPGERAIGSLLPSRGVGWPGGWSQNRWEQVAHMKNWTHVAINTICQRIAQMLPNMAYVVDLPTPGHVQKGGNPWSNGKWVGGSTRADQRGLFNTSNAGGFGGSCGYGAGGHSFMTVGEYCSKALSVIQPHEELEPLENDHELRRLVKNPNPFDTAFTLLYELQMFEELCGVSYLWAVPNRFGKPCELWVLPSHWVWPKAGGGNFGQALYDPKGRSEGYGLDPNEGNRGSKRFIHGDELISHYEIRPWGGAGAAGILYLPPNEVIMNRWPSPLNKIDGYSKLSAIAQWIDEEEGISRSRWAQMENTARPELHLKTPAGYADVDDDRIARLEAKIAQKLQGSYNYGVPLITAPGVEVDVLSFSPSEMAYIGSEEQICNMILSAFGVPKAAVGIGETMTYGSVLALLATFHENCINPRLAMRGQSLTKHLAHLWDQPGREVRIWWDNTVPADPAQVNSDLTTDAQFQAITPDEVRALRGRKPYRFNGDQPLVQGPGGLMPWPTNTREEMTDLAELIKPFTQPGQEQASTEQLAAEGLDKKGDEVKPGAEPDKLIEWPQKPVKLPETNLASDLGVEEPNGKPSKQAKALGQKPYYRVEVLWYKSGRISTINIWNDGDYGKQQAMQEVENNVHHPDCGKVTVIEITYSGDQSRQRSKEKVIYTVRGDKHDSRKSLGLLVGGEPDKTGGRDGGHTADKEPQGRRGVRQIPLEKAAQAEKTAAGLRGGAEAMTKASNVKVEIERAPWPVQDTHWRCIVYTPRGRAWYIVWADPKPTEQQVIHEWEQDRSTFKPLTSKSLDADDFWQRDEERRKELAVGNRAKVIIPSGKEVGTGEITYVGDRIEVMFDNGSGGMFPASMVKALTKSCPKCGSTDHEGFIQPDFENVRCFGCGKVYEPGNGPTPGKSIKKELIAAGLAVVANDTGRVLMLQRALDDGGNENGGKWEFPGGHIDEGEEPIETAEREWYEETGLPQGALLGAVSGSNWDGSNGKYRGFVYRVPSEESLDLLDRDPEVNPDGTRFEAIAWVGPEDFDNHNLRQEILDDLEMVQRAVTKLLSKAVAKEWRVRKSDQGWVGVDLDGTLAHYDGFEGPDVIGAPVPKMLERVLRWLAEGRDVRIFTARVADDPDGVALEAIQAWCLEHLGQELPVTNEKDRDMEELWDDRAVRVERNSGERVKRKAFGQVRKWSIEGIDPALIERAQAAVKRVIEEEGTGPDYQRLFWQPDTGKVWWVSADGDSEESVQRIKASLAAMPTATEVRVEAEAFPKGEGWVEIYPKLQLWPAKMKKSFEPGTRVRDRRTGKAGRVVELLLDRAGKASALVAWQGGGESEVPVERLEERVTELVAQKGAVRKETCTPGHTAERDGCTPAGGGGGKGPKEGKPADKPKRAAPGSQLPAHVLAKMKELGADKLPPASVPLDKIKVNLDAGDGGALMTWTQVGEKSGRAAQQSAYTPGFHARNAAEKWQRVESIEPHVENIGKALVDKMADKSLPAKERQAAAIASCIRETGLRPTDGAESIKHGHFGISSLQARHVKEKDGELRLDFIGKEGVRNRAVIREPENVAFVKAALAGKGPRDFVFDRANSHDAGAALKAASAGVGGPEDILVKDLRTVRATKLAERSLAAFKGPPPPMTGDKKRDEKLVSKAILAIATPVSEALNNSPQMSRDNYVHPRVWKQFAARLKAEE